MLSLSTSCDLNHELNQQHNRTINAEWARRKRKKKPRIELFAKICTTKNEGKTITIIPWIQWQTCSKLIETKHRRDTLSFFVLLWCELNILNRMPSRDERKQWRKKKERNRRAAADIEVAPISIGYFAMLLLMLNCLLFDARVTNESVRVWLLPSPLSNIIGNYRFWNFHIEYNQASKCTAYLQVTSNHLHAGHDLSHLW